MGWVWVLGLALGGCRVDTQGTLEPAPELPGTGTPTASVDTGDTSEDTLGSPVVALDPRLTLPVTYCTTEAFASRLTPEETAALFAGWEAADPDQVLFVDGGQCGDDLRAQLWLDYDGEVTGVIANLWGQSGVTVLAFGDVAWTTQAEIDAGNCTNAFNLQREVAHQVGHAAGVPNSCEQGEPCEEASRLDALMFWATAPCEDLAWTSWDIAALSAVQGLAGF